MMKASPIFVAVVLVSMTGIGAPPQPTNLPEGTQSSFETEEATVLKVYSAEKEGHRFVAYVVKWHGSEVIVSDPLAQSEHEVGDTIRFIAQEIAMARTSARVSVLHFIIAGSARGETANETPISAGEQRSAFHRLTQGDLDAAENEAERFVALNHAAKNALASGRTAEARQLATELILLAPKYQDEWNYGNAIQDANHVLGRIALDEGDIARAKECLLASANSKGSPQMNSFGPNMQLAKDLLAKGETEVVLEYFKRCGKFWTMGADRLAAWSEAVKAGQTPQFGGNLRY